MARVLRWVLPGLFVLALLVDLALWAGIRGNPEIGAVALRSAGKEAPLALLYMHAGTALAQPLGWQSHAQGFAMRRIGHAVPSVKASPQAAMDILLREMSGLVRLAHSGAPWLLAASLLLWVLRPRQVSLVKRG